MAHETDILNRATSPTAVDVSDARAILQPAIDAMPAHIAVLKPGGIILTVNDRWRQFADENGLRTPNYAIGQSYFDGWKDDAQGGPEPRAVREGIESVLAGQQNEFRALCPCHSAEAKRWFHLRVTPFIHNGVRCAVVSHANVTPLIEASEALRESEARFRNIADSVPIFIYMLRQDGAVEFINKPLRDYHGMSVEQLAGDGMYMPLHPDDIAPTTNAYSSAFRDPRPVSVEFRMRGKDGLYRWFINQSIPRFAADGSYLGYIGCCIDVHERKLAEHAVAASERRYRSIFETAAVAMWESDFSAAKTLMDEVKASGVEDIRAYLHAHPEFLMSCARAVRVRNVNDAAVRLTGAQSREHLISKFAELFAPETFSEFADELADLMEERGEYQRESVIRTLRGDVRRCMFTISLPPVASVDSVLAAVMDVTEQRTLQDALHRSEALNRAVLGSLKELIAVLDGNGHIIAVNQAWTDMAQRSGGVVLGEAVDVGVDYLEGLCRAGYGGTQQAKYVQDGIRRVLSGATELFETEFRCATPAGERWFMMTVVPLRGAGPGAVVVHADITDRKEAQNLMQALNARLLRAQEDERRRLAREMHDDVTQRLAVLAIQSGRLEMQLQASCSGCDGSAAAEKVRHMTEQIVKLSSDVHAISRQLHPSILDDLGLADAVESECQTFTDREGIAVALDIAPLPDSVPNDVALCLYRILQEGLRNVAKHAQTDRVRVTLAAEAAGREVVLRIADAGVGFDAPSARSGPGLGLASMRERARLVGAELRVTSSPGEGAAIEIRAPLTAAPASSPPPHLSPKQKESRHE
jgi:PAS domain S-box-containing protein